MQCIVVTTGAGTGKVQNVRQTMWRCMYDPFSPCENCGKCGREYDEDERDPDREYEEMRDKRGMDERESS